MSCPNCKHTEKRFTNFKGYNISYCANCGSNVSLVYNFTLPIKPFSFVTSTEKSDIEVHVKAEPKPSQIYCGQGEFYYPVGFRKPKKVK